MAQTLKITLTSYRHNIIQEALTHLFKVSQPTISRTIATVEKALTKVLEPLNRALRESLKAPVAPSSLMGGISPPGIGIHKEKQTFQVSTNGQDSTIKSSAPSMAGY